MSIPEIDLARYERECAAETAGCRVLLIQEEPTQCNP